MSGDCLVLDRLSRVFGGLKAVDEVSLTIRAGERHALIGPNGAGKTTLFNLISGEVPASSGRIMFFGTDVTSLQPHRRAALGMARTFQITNLFLNLSVLDNVLLACEALLPTKLVMYRPLASYGRLIEHATTLLEGFGLSALGNRLVRNISYGDQRKVEVALSLAGRPRLILLDEPMAGLSTGETHSMRELVQKLDPSVTVLLIEHDMDVAFALAERITVLYQGRVLTQGTRKEISANEMVQKVYLGTDVPGIA